jgi:hypothetical protein
VVVFVLNVHHRKPWPLTAFEYFDHSTSSLHPLDGALNLPPEKYSLEVRCRVAIEAAKSWFDEGVKTLEAFTGAHVPKRQFEQEVWRRDPRGI